MRIVWQEPHPRPRDWPPARRGARLATADPRNVEYQRDRSISHANIGRALLLKEDRDGALVAFRADLGALREMRKKLAEVYTAAGDRAQAASAAQQADRLRAGNRP